MNPRSVPNSTVFESNGDTAIALILLPDSTGAAGDQFAAPSTDLHSVDVPPKYNRWPSPGSIARNGTNGKLALVSVIPRVALATLKPFVDRASDRFCFDS